MKKKSCKFGQIERDFGEAFKYFKIAAEKGDKEAMFRYGEFLEKGVPQIPIDIIAAKNWYKKSYEGEDLGGYAEYGYTLISSKYGKTDEPEGYRLIKYSADHENPMGMLVYGHIIQSGMLCVQQDNKRAFELIKKAADMGEPNAITAIGMFYEKGIYVKQSSYTAIKYYKFALEEGSMIAIEHLGEVYKKGGDGFSANPMESRSYYKIGADAGLRESIYQYCLNMYNDDIVLNYIYEIRKYLEIGRKLKDEKSILFLGNLYLKGDLFPKMKDLGEMLVKESAELGYKEAMKRYIDMYENGNEGFYGNPPEIQKYKDILGNSKSRACLLI